MQLYNSEPSQSKQYVFEYSATTSWTRITHTVLGNSGLEIDNDVNHGLDLYFNLFHGTASTDNSYVNNQWNNYGGGNPQYKDNTSTWYTTNNATWEITGLQVEVGQTATDFEHLSFADDGQKVSEIFLYTKFCLFSIANVNAISVSYNNESSSYNNSFSFWFPYY